MSNEYAEITGMLEGALTGIDALVEQALYHTSAARDAYALRHGNERMDVSSSIEFALSDLRRLGTYLDDVTARAKAIHPEAPKICRTCGFADCPGAVTGDCPRWPSREDADTGYVGRHRRG